MPGNDNTGQSANLISLGHNLVGFLNDDVERIASGYLTDDLLGGTSADDPAIDPNLARLVQASANGLNGTFRHNLIQGSPAVDAGDESIYPDTAPNTDQIGQPRILDGNSDANRVIDIGARERFINRPVASFTLSGNPVGVNELVELDGTSSNHTLSLIHI